MFCPFRWQGYKKVQFKPCILQRMSTIFESGKFQNNLIAFCVLSHQIKAKKFYLFFFLYQYMAYVLIKTITRLMTRGKSHETESLDCIIGLWLESKKSNFELRHHFDNHLFQMYHVLSSLLLPLNQQRGLRRQFAESQI